MFLKDKSIHLKPYRGTLALVFVVAVSAYLTYYLWGPNLRAQWSLIDDHEIFRFLGQDQRISFFDIPRLWLASEVGQFGESVRYRPSYFFLRLWECYLWGPVPHLWYLSRLVMFAVSFGILLWLVSRAVGLFLATSFALFLATARCWPSIWACLGPAETYACFGAALFCLGFYRRWTKSGEPASADASAGVADVIDWVLLATGAVIAMGSKENFVFLALPTAWLAIGYWRRRTLTFAGTVAAFIVVAVGVAIGVAVSLAVASSGKDIYLNSVKPADRIPLVMKGAAHAPVVWVLAVALLALAALTPFRKSASKKYQLWLACLKTICVWEAVLAALYVSQIYYYNAVWTADSRYAFPGDLIGAFGIFLPLMCLLQNPSLLPDPSINNARRIRVVAGLFLLLLTWLRGFDPAIQRSRQNAILTRAVTGCMNRVSDLAARYPVAPVVLSTTSLGDYESYYAVKTFLRIRGVANPIVIEKSPVGYAVAGFPPALGKQLLQNVEDMMQKGTEGFTPHSVVDTSPVCISMGFSHDPAPSRCIAAGKLVP